MRWLLLCLICCAGPLRAQVVLDLPGLVAVMEEPWRDGPAFEARLAAVLPGLVIRGDQVPGGVEDPMAWIREGSFAAVPGVAPVGAFVLCVRIGLATRDFLAERLVSDPASFEIFSAYQLEHDALEAWPEAAVARVSCLITWDDSRAVAVLPPETVRRALQASFFSVVNRVPEGQAAFYGPDGYRMMATGGRADTVVELESAVLVLTERHQSVRLRSFLMNGGS